MQGLASTNIMHSYEFTEHLSAMARDFNRAMWLIVTLRSGHLSEFQASQGASFSHSSDETSCSFWLARRKEVVLQGPSPIDFGGVASPLRSSTRICLGVPPLCLCLFTKETGEEPGETHRLIACYDRLRANPWRMYRSLYRPTSRICRASTRNSSPCTRRQMFSTASRRI